MAELTPVNALRELPTLWKHAAAEAGGVWANATGLLGGPSYWTDVGVVLGAGRRAWPRTAMGWAVTPWAFARVLAYVHHTYHPRGGIRITENGVALEDSTSEEERTCYLRDHLANLHWVITHEQVDVRAYYVWSLIDNFEWQYGYTKRFGLYRVDFETLAREKRLVADVYATVVRENGVRVERETVDPFRSR